MSIRCRPVSVALLGLFLWTTACSSYSQIEPGEVSDHDHVRVIMTDGVRYDLYDPVVEADSVRGREEAQTAPDYPYPLLAIPLDQVSTLEGSHGDTLATVGLTVGLVVGVLGVLMLVECSGGGCNVY